jgi:hypothetical protein
MLAQCPKFEGAPSEYTDEGKKRHNVLAEYLKGNKKVLEEVNENFREDLEWALEYIDINGPKLDHPTIIETMQEGVLPNGLPIKGTPDVVIGPEVFDLKWRPRDYRPQMAAYAYMILDSQEAITEIRTHLLFGSTQTVRKHKWTKESAWDCIREIIANVESAWAAPIPCEYCGWCAKRPDKCEALIQQVNIALASNPEWNLPQWHSSEIKTAEQMGMALRIARTLADWCESVEYHAKEMAIKQGMVPTGFAIQNRQGNRFIDDVSAAFKSSTLPQDEFIKACAVKPRILFDTYAAFHGMAKKAAERELEQKLGAIMQRKAPSSFLVTERTSKKKDK